MMLYESRGQQHQRYRGHELIGSGTSGKIVILGFMPLAFDIICTCYVCQRIDIVVASEVAVEGCVVSGELFASESTRLSSESAIDLDAVSLRRNGCS